MSERFDVLYWTRREKSMPLVYVTVGMLHAWLFEMPQWMGTCGGQSLGSTSQLVSQFSSVRVKR